MSNTFGVVARLKAPIGFTGVWVNIYKYKHRRGKYQSGGAYGKRIDADKVAYSYRHACVYAHVPIDKVE